MAEWVGVVVGHDSGRGLVVVLYYREGVGFNLLYLSSLLFPFFSLL